MKSKLLLSFLFFLLIFKPSFINAQSDLEIVKAFKSAVETLESDIDKAKSITEIPDFEARTKELKDKYTAKKALLDKALYPETFETTFQKINSKIEVMKGKLSQISDLQVEVTDLKGKLEELKEYVNRLSEDYYNTLREVVSLRESNKKDRRTIDSLNSLLKKLRENSKQRNSLIDELANSLFFNNEKSVESMNEVEKKELFVKFKSSNMLENIKRLIADNTEYVKAGAFTTKQLDEFKLEQREFKSRWNAIGAKIAQVYASPKERDAELNKVNQMINNWDEEINTNIWQNIDVQFKLKDIVLKSYNNGDEFYNSVIEYIDKQIKNEENKSSDERYKTYYTFADSVYFKTIADTWIPLLVRYKMIDENKVSDIESKIKDWNSSLGEPMPSWIYTLVIAVIILVLVVLIIVLVAKNRNLKMQLNEKNKDD